MLDMSMQTTVVAGLFTVLAAILGALVPHYYKVELRRVAAGARDLHRLLPGTWVGQAQEIEYEGSGSPISYAVTWKFTVRGRKVYAVSTLSGKLGGKKVTGSYTLSGYFLHDRFIRLEYFNDNRNEVNFGTEVLHVDDGGTKFVGRFVGYSAERKCIVSGSIEGTKVFAGSGTAA